MSHCRSQTAHVSQVGVFYVSQDLGSDLMLLVHTLLLIQHLNHLMQIQRYINHTVNDIGGKAI